MFKAIRTNNNFLLCKEFKKKLLSNPDIYKYIIIIIDKKVKRLIVIVYNTNIISNKINDKPKQINLLDLSTDILNIIGDFVKKDNLKREKNNLKRGREEIENVEQIINEKKIDLVIVFAIK